MRREFVGFICGLSIDGVRSLSFFFSASSLVLDQVCAALINIIWRRPRRLGWLAGSEAEEMNSSFAPLRGHSPNPSFTNANRSTFAFRLLDDENAPPDPTMAADAIIPGGMWYPLSKQNARCYMPSSSVYYLFIFRKHLQLTAEQRARP